MNCMFLRRKEFSNVTDVLSLFKKATVTNIDGRDGGTAGTISIATANVPNGILYGFGRHMQYSQGFSVYKISNKTVASTRTLVWRSNTGYETTIKNYTSGGVDGIYLAIGTNNPANLDGTLALLQFNVPESLSDEILNASTLTSLASPSGNASGTLTTPSGSTSHKLVITCCGPLFTAWHYGTQWEKVVSTTTQCGTVSGTTISVSHTRGAAQILALD